jgi:tetratricopeptide (TPR) repeat protein
MNKHQFPVIAFTVLFIAGCANPINLHTAQRYHDAGIAAESAGDFELAHQNYYRAYMNTEWGNANERQKALAMYNLGRLNGFLCRKTEAEQLLTKSVEIEGKETNKSGDWYLGRLMETAKFYYAYNDYEKSIPYFKEGSEIAIKQGLDKKYPLEFSGILKMYADALKKTGRNDQSELIVGSIQDLPPLAADSKERFSLPPYNKNCSEVK